MPATENTERTLFTSTTPVPTSETAGALQEGGNFDHVLLLVKFTIGSLTNIKIKPQFTCDGTNWYDVYDANQGLIEITLTATFNAFIYLGSPQNNTRMQPAVIGSRMWRMAVTGTGTNTSSSIEILGITFTPGMMPA